MKTFVLVVILAACGGSASQTGDACVADAECEEVCIDNLVFNNGDDLPFSEGYCSTECDGAWDCPKGENCLSHNWDEPSHCYVYCEREAECRVEDDYTCVPLGGGSYCLPKSLLD